MSQRLRPLEQQRPKRQENQKRKETSQPHPKEREDRNRKQKRQPVDKSNDLHDVGNDDEMSYWNTESSKAKAKSEDYTANMEEIWKNVSSQGPGLDLSLIGRDSTPMRVKITKERVEAEKNRRNLKPLPEIPGAERTASSKKIASGPGRVPSRPRPGNVPADEHLIRQHLARNADENTLIDPPPRGSSAARYITPWDFEEENLPTVGGNKTVFRDATIVNIQAIC